MAGEPISETFTVEADHLARHIVPQRGQPYTHRCPLASLVEVAHAFNEAAGQGLTLDELSARTGLPNNAVNTAFAFLKERGIVVPGHRRTHVSASRDVYLDAMTEYHALRERPTA